MIRYQAPGLVRLNSQSNQENIRGPHLGATVDSTTPRLSTSDDLL